MENVPLLRVLHTHNKKEFKRLEINRWKQQRGPKGKQGIDQTVRKQEGCASLGENDKKVRVTRHVGSNTARHNRPLLN